MKKMTKKILAIGIIALLVLGVGLVAAINADEIENNYVSKEKAREHATVTMLEFVLAGTPGLEDEDWKGATINPEPLTIYDINGKKLYYQFSVEKDGKTVGGIKTAASKVLGASVCTIELTPRAWDPDIALKKAKEIAKKQYEGAEITSTTLVCYGYPRIGVMLKLHDPKTGEEQRLFIDASDYSVVQDRMPELGLEGPGVWSLYESIPKEEWAQRVSDWEVDDKHAREVITKAHSAGIDISKSLSEKELETLREALASPRSYKVISGFHLFGQEKPYYCAPATGQMIADYYDVSHTQDHIADEMGTASGGTTMSGQLDYYTGNPPDCLDKSGSYDDYDCTWEKAKDEIDANRPLKSGVPRHARACAGWWSDGTNYLYIYDPLPVNEGDRYWESWDSIEHTNYIYVLD